MTGDVFLSNEEYLKQQNLIKARQQRIIQVREQSKNMATAILNKMRIEADKQYQQTENRILSEIRQHYSRELASVRQHYHRCINDINRQHYVKHTASIVNEKKKQPKLSKNNRKPEQAEPINQISKKLPESQNEESELNKTAIDSVSVKKIPMLSSMVSKTNSQKLKKLSIDKAAHLHGDILKPKEAKLPIDKAPYLPENVIIKPNNASAESLRNETLLKSGSQNKSTNLKKFVNFLNKENYEVEKPYTSPVKRYPAYAKKPTVYDSNKTKMNKPGDCQIYDDVLIEHDENEIYNRLVHDRIRILEQKEKILRRQSPMSPSISSASLISKPAKFSEYFSNVHISVTSQKHPPANNQSQIEELPKATLHDSNGISSENINNDVDRVENKKKLLFLELSNAETQTERNVSLNSDYTLDGSDQERNESQTTNSKQPCADPLKASKSPKKNFCPSPILRERENSDKRTVKPKKLKTSEHHCCKRKQVKSNGVTVTVSGNPASVSTNSSDSDFSHSYPTAVSSLQSDVAHTNYNHSHKTVQVVVNVLSSSEVKGKKSKSLDRHKGIAYVIPKSQLKKVTNWRKLFDNDEKMTESSYFSPPDVVLKNQNRIQYTKPRSKAAESRSDEKSPDLGYYVQKLLLMRPESIENLDVSSCSTVTIDEVTRSIDNKPEKKSRMKIPLYQNSFEDTKVVKKSTRLPLYQNSFDDTIDAVCDIVLKSQYNDTSSKDTSSLEDENTGLFSQVIDDQNLLAMSDSSKFLTENSIPPASTLKKSEDVSKSSSCIKIFRSDENEHAHDETEDDEIKLPSVEELCKRGFVSEQFLNQKSAEEQETMEEEEFLHHLLSINLPNDRNDKVSRADCKSSPCTEVICDMAEKNVSPKLPKHSDEKDDVALNFSHKLKTSASNLKNENNLLGWMGAMVQRTLQASAINSTSSGDSSDPVRRTYKTLENLTEQTFENSSENDTSLFKKHFILSPIKVPDIHLTISPVLKNSE